MYLHLLARHEHHEACKADRCARSCDVAQFLAHLEEPLLLGDIQRKEREAERLTALAKGEIPRAG